MTIAKSVQNMYPDRELVDADENLEIDVIRQDVTKSEPLDPRGCAIARCVKREYDVQDAVIYKSVAYLVYEDQIVRYKLNHGVQEEIVSFDRSKSFAPGHYHLNRPAPAHRLDANRLRGTKRGPHTTRHKRPKVVGVRRYGD